MRVCTAKSSDMLLEIVTDKDKLSLNEIHAFFSQRNSEEYKLAEEEHFLSIPKSEREPQRKPNFSSILITWNFETTNSYGNIETSKRILMEDKLTYLFNNTSKTNASWQNLQLLTRVLVGRKGEFKYNFDADEHIHCQDPVVADIVSAARRALLSFAKVLPRSAKGFISNEDDLAYQEELREQNLDNLFIYCCAKVYFFISLYYSIELNLFTAEFNFNYKNEIYLTDLQIYSRRPCAENQALKRIIKNQPRIKHSEDRANTRVNSKQKVDQLLLSFAQKLINNKIDGIIYWANQNKVEIPDDFYPVGDQTYYDLFIERVKTVDPLFENKFYFYLAKERLDYERIDSFLNSYLIRHWPELKAIVLSRQNLVKKSTENLPSMINEKYVQTKVAFKTEDIKPRWMQTVTQESKHRSFYKLNQKTGAKNVVSGVGQAQVSVLQSLPQDELYIKYMNTRSNSNGTFSSPWVRTTTVHQLEKQRLRDMQFVASRSRNVFNEKSDNHVETEFTNKSPNSTKSPGVALHKALSRQSIGTNTRSQNLFNNTKQKMFENVNSQQEPAFKKKLLLEKQDQYRKQKNCLPHIIFFSQHK